MSKTSSVEAGVLKTIPKKKISLQMLQVEIVFWM